MNKAEERALEMYPKEWWRDCDGDAWDANESRREGFIQGYKQAEKDLELTWEDMQRIWQIIDIANEECDKEKPEWMYGSESFFSEVLRRFKEAKK